MRAATLEQALDRLDRDDPAVAELAAALERWLREGGRIDDHLGVADRAEHQRRRRDHHLREAAAALPADLGPWSRAVRLAEELRRYQTARWRRWSHLVEAPVADRVVVHLHRALRAGAVPGTARALADILARTEDRNSLSTDFGRPAG